MTQERLNHLAKLVLKRRLTPFEEVQVSNALCCLGDIVQWAYKNMEYPEQLGRGYGLAQLDVQKMMKEAKVE